MLYFRPRRCLFKTNLDLFEEMFHIWKGFTLFLRNPSSSEKCVYKVEKRYGSRIHDISFKPSFTIFDQLNKNEINGIALLKAAMFQGMLYILSAYTLLTSRFHVMQRMYTTFGKKPTAMKQVQLSKACLFKRRMDSTGQCAWMFIFPFDCIHVCSCYSYMLYMIILTTN